MISNNFSNIIDMLFHIHTLHKFRIFNWIMAALFIVDNLFDIIYESGLVEFILRMGSPLEFTMCANLIII